MTEETCYMCEKVRTSGEHVPPKCLFPENKDVEPGENYRKNLIKVPSCDEHNSAKSQDDEFMLITFASNMVTEEVGGRLQNSKLMRIVDRKPHIFAELLRNSTPMTVVDKDGIEHQTCAFSLDRERFMKQMQSVANGIYYHHLQTKVTGKTEVVPIKGFQTTSLKVNQNNQKTKEFATKLFPTLPTYGDNPDIFYYQVSSDSPNMLMKLVFYRHLEFIAVFNI
ncbi:hypothetical protein [Vibrio parahaemolyticus]|uniref:hypothetical protein n=1 Tax=Vibrio parahaemolyticus TaxID=670 RepID=UPI00226A58CB|nr:hypothetical protein [Vibrio parahaemolyticus]MCX8904292.1 hypothetical protein [Vibrio parahaemolyticus]